MKISYFTPHKERGAGSQIWYLILAFVLLGLIYTVAVPVFEAPDEPWHFNYIRYVAQGRGLPSLRDNDSGAYQEVGQPPLYYLVAGLVTAPLREYDVRGLTLHNPGFGYQAPGTVNDNKNLLVHTAQEAFPWQGALLAIHLARLVSLAFGALTVLATWGLACEMFPDSPFLAMAAAAIVAFIPQFVFSSSVASNDSSAAALSTATLWAIARMMRLGVTYRRAALTGLLVGLASLTKTSTILLGLFGVAAILCRPQTADCRPWAAVSRRWSEVIVLIVVALGVGGWWYARNGILYGDPLGLSVHLNTPWARPAPVSLMAVLPTLPLAYRSFWGAFGWGNVELSPVIYVVLGLVLIVALAGGLIGWVKRQPAGNHRSSAMSYQLSAVLLMCFLWCGAIFVSFLRWNQQVEAPHGRLLFPVIGAFAVLLVAGLARLPRPRVALGSVIAGLFLLSFAAPFAYIRPAYAWPEQFPVEQLSIRHPSFAIRNLSYDDQARLVGFALGRASVAPGEWLDVTLCWMAVKPMTRNYSVFVHLLGPENLVVGARNTWPGLGRFPTSLWPTDQAFCDTIPVRVEGTAPVPQVYAVEVGLYDADDRLEATDVSTGQSVQPPIVGHVRIAPKQPLQVKPQRPAQAEFGSVTLIGFDAPDQARPNAAVTLQLYWRTSATLDRDYTVFVHLLDASGHLAAQADSEPRGGLYPTSAWMPNDVIPDEHTLKLPAGLPPGEYSIRVGLYLAPDGPRLPLKPSGDSFTLGVLRVMP